jgi:hypothetical protein
LTITGFSDSAIKKIGVIPEGPKHGKIDYWQFHDKRLELRAAIEMLCKFKELLQNNA